MNRIVFLFALFILSVTTVSFADDNEQVITLKDGSQIIGELVGINNGVYTIKAPIIGNVQASASDVVSITNRNQASSSPSNPGTYPTLPIAYPSQATQAPGNIPNLDQRVAAEQKQLMSNPQSMALLMQMAQDPEIAQMLQDPALVQAVTTHDLNAVQNNPSVQKLMSNPHMQAFLKQLEAQQQQQTPASH